MSTSLAAQLAQRTTLDSARLQTAKTLKNPPSFIFSTRHAASVSTADLHSLASNAWDQLSTLDPFFEKYQNRILGEEAKATDRSSLTKEENEKLGLVLDKVLRALGKHMLLKPAGVVLEWLVRRFRVNDLNISALIGLFMPYHTTAHFPSALNLISETSLREAAPFSVLIDARASLAPIALTDLISLLPPFNPRPTARGLLDFLLRLPLKYTESDEKVHRALTGFWLQLVAGYIDRAGSKMLEGERAAVLSTVLEVLRSARDQPDLLIATYIALARFSLHTPFEGETLRVVVKTIVSNKAKRDVADQETDAAFVTTLVVITQLGEGFIDVGEGKKFLGGSGWKSLIKVDRLDDLLVQLSNEYDARKFMTPFLATLSVQALESESEATLIRSLLTPRDDPEVSSSQLVLPDAIVALISKSALTAAISAPDDMSVQPLVTPLTQIAQRWPMIWATESAKFAGLSSDGKAPRFWSIMNAVQSGGKISAAPDDAASSVFLSSSNPDSTVRIKALKDLIRSVEELAEANPSFVHDTLVARLAESNPEVAKVVLATSTLPILHKYLSAEDVFKASKLSLSAANRECLAVVLPYLANEYLQAYPEMVDRVAKEVFWSRLLKVKSDGTDRLIAWKAIKDSKLESAQVWLSGISSAFDLSEAQNEDAGAKSAAQHNAAVVDRLSKNIAGLPSVDLDAALDFISTGIDLSHQSGSHVLNASAQTLCSLVAGHLAGHLKPNVALTFASRILERLNVANIGLDSFDNGDEDVESDAFKAAMSHSIFSRPVGPKTHRRVRIVLLLSIVAAVRPVEKSAWSWLAVDEEDEAVAVYQHITRTVYGLAHARSSTESTIPSLSTSLLRSLYSNLVADDALAFLTSIFTSSANSVELRCIALRDAAIFIRTQALPELRKPVDWQVFVPALVVALADADRRIRVIAMEVVSMTLASMAKSTAHIYGREKFYGASSSSAIQYLDVGDTSGYLAKILAAKTEIILDGSYLITLHGSLLDTLDQASPSKKKITLKVKASTFLLSHALTWRADARARTSLLRSVSGVKDTFVLGLILPILRQVVVESSVEERLAQSARLDQVVVTEFGRLLLQPYASATKKWIDPASGNSALDTLNVALELDELVGLGAVIRKEAFRVLAASLFGIIRGEQRFEMLKRLIRLGSSLNARLTSDPLATLRAIKVDADTLTAFLNEIRLSAASPVSKGAKRGRTSVGGSTTSGSNRADRIPELVVALESVDMRKLNATHSLLLAFFELLSALIEIPAATQVDVQYPGQLILSSLAELLSRVEPSSNVITTESIRMSPVFDLMRSSSNPQTYHQALLLLAKLGPLVPDQLVHHVMPIFTFVGANVLQRDDAYSLRVVDQTLESIIPALVKATKRKSSDRKALVGELKELLQIFADAAEHMPRHRRVKLFVRFVETLGAQEFLSAMSMLLAERDIKMADGSQLSLLVLEQFDVGVQLAAYHQIVSEVSHLLEGDQSFLDRRSCSAGADGDSSDGVASQIEQLLSLLELALDSRQMLSKVDSSRASGDEEVDTSLTSLLRGLLDLTSTASSLSSESKAELDESVNACVRSTVHLLSTSSFSEALLWLLDLSDPSIQPRAFELLRARLQHIKPSRRREISPAVVAVIDRIRTVLSSESADLDGALETLDVIVSSVYPDEDTALSKLVSYLIALAESSNVTTRARSLAMVIITKLTNRLGPRLIPLVAKLVPFSVEMLQKEARISPQSELAAPAFDILEGLFSSIPTFIGAHIDKVFDAALSSHALKLTRSKDSAANGSRAAMLSTAAKRLPAKTLYPSIVRLHASLGSEPTRDSIIGLLDLLTRALRHGKTTDIAEGYKSIFKLFLSIFDLRRLQPSTLDSEDINQIEESGLGAFVQFILKLNEQTFRPLFLRTYDWAVIDVAEQGESASSPRRIVLFKLVGRLLSQLRSIFVSYFSFMIDQTAELLDAFAKGTNTDAELWKAVVGATTKAIDYDESGFWTPLRLGKLTTPIADQVLVSSQIIGPSLVGSHYEPLISHYSERLVAHERLLKQLNTSLLMHTRSDDLRVKRSAIETLERVWIALGDGMLGLVPETTPFLSETLEESEGDVEKATRSLIRKIEEHLGESLDTYLEA